MDSIKSLQTPKLSLKAVVRVQWSFFVYHTDQSLQLANTYIIEILQKNCHIIGDEQYIKIDMGLVSADTVGG